jgi:multicomponent K+:H+ antiporter subunit E
MKRWLPYPLFSFALLAMWLVLAGSASPGHVLIGAAVGAGGGLLLASLQRPTARVRRRAGIIAALFWEVLVDIVRSNVAVARIAFHPRSRGRTAGFLALPLAVRHPGALAILACIITATPGTSWAGYDAARNELLIHVLDLVDKDEWVRLFKQRYERRLLAIFE